MNKRGIIFFAVTVLLNALLSGCSLSAENRKTSAGPVLIRIFAQQESSLNLAGNDFSKLLENRFNVKFIWETVPYEGAREKRQISLAAGNYADTYILTSYIDQFSQADVLRYGKQSVFIPLNDLIERYAPHIKAAFEKDPVLKEYNTAPDGNIYGLVAYNQCFHCSYPNKMWLNKKWLKRLGLTMPRTTEEFRNVLAAFKTRDPNGNGLADEVPLSGSTEDFGVRVIPFLMNGFIYDDDRNYLILRNGKADTSANKPEWKEGLSYIKSLYDEGLIDPGAFTQNADAFRKIGDNRETQILGAGAAMHPWIFVDNGPGNTRGSDYNPVIPLAGPHASYAVYQGPGATPGAKFVITDKAGKEAQIALIKMVDFMFTPEGQALAEVGKEGVEWRRPVAGEKALGPNTAPAFTRITDAAEPGKTGWGGMGHFYMPKEYRDSWVQGKDIYGPDGYERRLYAATVLYEGKEPNDLYPAWSVWMDSAEADEAGILQTNIRNYVDENALQFISGNKDLNKDWNSYVQGLNNLGLPRYLEIMQKAYDMRLKKNERLSNETRPSS